MPNEKLTDHIINRGYDIDYFKLPAVNGDFCSFCFALGIFKKSDLGI